MIKYLKSLFTKNNYFDHVKQTKEEKDKAYMSGYNDYLEGVNMPAHIHGNYLEKYYMYGWNDSKRDFLNC